MQAGYAGKLPAYGDFVEGGGAVRVRQGWSTWAERGLAATRESGNPGFHDIFLTSPIWRFAVAGGVFGEKPAAGVFCPSMDKVGRLFPFAIIANLPEGAAPTAAAAALGPWYDRLEAAALAALDPAATLETLGAALEDPHPVRTNGAVHTIAATSRIEPLPVTAEGVPTQEGSDALDLSDAEPEDGDGVWITLGGIDASAHGIMHYGGATDALFARLVTGGAAHDP